MPPNKSCFRMQYNINIVPTSGTEAREYIQEWIQ